MEALMDLCDLVAQNPVQFADKLTWMCNRCPQPDVFLVGSPRVTRSQLNAVLAISRFLSKCPNSLDPRPTALALEFFRSIPRTFAGLSSSFWPQSSSAEVSTFFSDFLGYLTLAAQLSQEFSDEIAELVGGVVTAAIDSYNNAGGEDQSPVPKAFLVSLSKHGVVYCGRRRGAARRVLAGEIRTAGVPRYKLWGFVGSEFPDEQRRLRVPRREG